MKPPDNSHGSAGETGKKENHYGNTVGRCGREGGFSLQPTDKNRENTKTGEKCIHE